MFGGSTKKCTDNQHCRPRARPVLGSIWRIRYVEDCRQLDTWSSCLQVDDHIFIVVTCWFASASCFSFDCSTHQYTVWWRCWPYVDSIGHLVDDVDHIVDVLLTHSVGVQYIFTPPGYVFFDCLARLFTWWLCIHGYYVTTLYLTR